jgi:signal peptidase II
MILTVPPRDNFGGTTMFFKICTPYFKKGFFMIYYVLLMVSIVFADQLTKWLAVINLKGEESFPFWEGVFHFTYVENRGSAFGMLKDHRWVFMTASTVIIIASLFIFFYYYKKLTPLMRWAIAFIVAGGIGNMIDRVFLGYVVDFLDFTLIDFAVFNVADSFVCIGAGLLFLWYLFDIVNEFRMKKKEKLALANGGAEEAKQEAVELSSENCTKEESSDIEENAETSCDAVIPSSEEKKEAEVSKEPENSDGSDKAPTSEEETTESGKDE